MRAMRVAAAAVLCGATVMAWNAPGASSSENVRVVQVRDECDPTTFNAVIPGLCIEEGGRSPSGRFGPGNVEFGEFAAALNPEDFGHDKWRFNPDDTTIHRGQALKPVNRGGEFHTFTKVSAFGAGCVPELNQPLGLTGPPVADCGAAFANSALPPGGSLTVRDLAPGTHLFECMIHPWMTTEVQVRSD
ncbi:MAG: hypothetical protein ABIS21_05245 [Acidimicrobiales bacterium]